MAPRVSADKDDLDADTDSPGFCLARVPFHWGPPFCATRSGMQAPGRSFSRKLQTCCSAAT